MTAQLDRMPGLMEAPEEPAQTPRWMRRLGRATRAATGLAADVLGASTPVALRHVRDHGYGILGLGFLDAGAFAHSLLVGLFATGASFLIFEWKVSEE